MTVDTFSAFLENDASLLLRRYLAFWKFEHLLNSQALYFSPASVLRDKREGDYTNADYERWESELATWGFEAPELRVASSAKAKVHQHNQKATSVICWTATSFETHRMWLEYGTTQEAVAVETTVGALRAELGTTFPIIRVRYIDYETGVIPKEHSVLPYCYKQRCYDWENEVRIIGDMEPGQRIGTPRLVKVDVSHLFLRVIVAPTAGPTFFDRVGALLDRHGLSIPLLPSCLAA